MSKSDIDLYELISFRKVEELEAALKSGGDPNQLDNYGLTPVFRVVYNPSEHQARLLELLIQYGADVNFRSASHGETAIHNAKSIGIAEILLRNGADITINTLEGRTPLHKARTAEMAQFFIDHGIDVNARDHSGSTALFDAVYDGPELVDCLLKNGARADFIDKRGETPLMRVAQSEYADDEDNIGLVRISERLIDSGADIHAIDSDGKSAFDHAVGNRNTALANFLQSKKQP